MSVIHFTSVTTAKEPFFLGAWITVDWGRAGPGCEGRASGWGWTGSREGSGNGNLQERLSGFLHPMCIFQWSVDTFLTQGRRDWVLCLKSCEDDEGWRNLYLFLMHLLLVLPSMTDLGWEHFLGRVFSPSPRKLNKSSWALNHLLHCQPQAFLIEGRCELI